MNIIHALKVLFSIVRHWYVLHINRLSDLFIQEVLIPNTFTPEWTWVNFQRGSCGWGSVHQPGEGTSSLPPSLIPCGPAPSPGSARPLTALYRDRLSPLCLRLGLGTQSWWHFPHRLWRPSVPSRAVCGRTPRVSSWASVSSQVYFLLFLFWNISGKRQTNTCF